MIVLSLWRRWVGRGRWHPFTSVQARHAVWLLLWAAPACIEGAGPTFPSDAIAFDPPLPYRRWWQMTEQCSGRAADFSSVTWYVVRQPTLTIGDGVYDGFWYGSGNRIVLAQPYLTNGATVRHEMLHALLQRGDHPLDKFTDRCGGVVGFGDDLRRAPASGQPMPGPSSPVLEPTALGLGVEVTPQPVSVGMPDSGWVSMTVSLTNPRSDAVWVHLTRLDSLNPYRRAFGFELTIGPTAWPSDERSTFFADSLMPFGPHETKRQVFDARLSPFVGSWSIRASFNSASDGWRSFSVTP